MPPTTSLIAFIMKASSPLMMFIQRCIFEGESNRCRWSLNDFTIQQPRLTFHLNLMNLFLYSLPWGRAGALLDARVRSIGIRDAVVLFVTSSCPPSTAKIPTVRWLYRCSRAQNRIALATGRIGGAGGLFCRYLGWNRQCGRGSS